MKHIMLKLTEKEAKALWNTAENGWGDGDFADWLDAGELGCENGKAFIRAHNKLEIAIFGELKERADAA